MNIPKESFNNASETMKKYAPSVMSVVGAACTLEALRINAKQQARLADAYSYMDASYELYKAEVKQNRSIFHRVKMFFKRLFHK